MNEELQFLGKLKKKSVGGRVLAGGGVASWGRGGGLGVFGLGGGSGWM